jgi:AhpD family alkylhydroperoxidase
MTSRPNPFVTRHDLIEHLIKFGTSAQEGLDPAVQELIKIRSSQINGCGTCLQMHTRDARSHGETEERIYMLDAWRESLLYSESERAVLAWTEALTRVDQAGAPDHAYEALQAHFSEEEQIKITLLVAAINAFNRVNVGLRVRLPGSAGRKVA